ncbi:MAG: hypothetical protein LH469_04180 [Frankiaceae bacterium]|nr:hypothetical protein [Frankiaceae bacterium]
MPSPVPTPVAAALGIVPTVLDGVRRLPGKVVQLPVYAVSHALTTLGTARREYDALAERGERLLTRLRGTSFDEVEDVVEDALQGTPFAKPYDVVEDALEDAGEAVTKLARTGTTRARKAAGTTTRRVGAGLDKAADGVEDAAAKAANTVGTAVADVAAEVPEAEAPKGEPTPPAPDGTQVQVDSAASPETVEVVERVSATVGGQVLAHEDLPLPDYDHLTLGSLRGRMRSLDLPQLVQIRDYEKAHADRLPIVTMLDNRIVKLANDPTAPLSGGGTDGAETAGGAKGGSKVSPSTADAGADNPTVAFGGLGGAGKPS